MRGKRTKLFDDKRVRAVIAEAKKLGLRYVCRKHPYPHVRFFLVAKSGCKVEQHYSVDGLVSHDQLTPAEIARTVYQFIKRDLS